MFISVIVTCYNLENYIAEAIRSVIAQDYEPDLFEIIVIDDCSIDKSAQIIDSFESVKYIRTPKNVGVLLATVIGMQFCKGEIISFLDGDDIWRTDKLRRVADCFKKDRSLIFLTHNYKFVNEIGKDITGTEHTQKKYSKLITNDNVDQFIIEGILQRKNYVWLGSAYSIRLKTDDISNFINWTKCLPNPKLTYQDWPLAFWIAASCHGTFSYENEKLLSYRIHSDNFSGDSRTLDKSIRNWSKSYYTSLAILQISEKFHCSNLIQSICRSAVLRDQMILQLFQQPYQFSFFNFLSNIDKFGSFDNKIKETVRVFMIKIFGIRNYFLLKNNIIQGYVKMKLLSK